jgi:hypothetical protein
LEVLLPRLGIMPPYLAISFLVVSLEMVRIASIARRTKCIGEQKLISPHFQIQAR